jgi:hypothetical protein
MIPRRNMHPCARASHGAAQVNGLRWALDRRRAGGPGAGSTVEGIVVWLAVIAASV